MTVNPTFTQMSARYRDWYRDFLSKPDWALPVFAYVGPFPVGPAGYRTREVAELADAFARDAVRFGAEPEAAGPVIPLPERPELTIRGVPDAFRLYAFDAESGVLVASMTGEGTFRDPASSHRSVTAEFHRVISRARSKSYSVMDFSQAGFAARVKAHALIVGDALREGKPVPPHNRDAYADTYGEVRLRTPYTAKEHNLLWDVEPDTRHFASAHSDWYERRDELWPDMVFRTTQGDTVRLYQRVEGDGTRWEVETWDGGWFHDGDTVEPGDLSEQVPDPQDAKPRGVGLGM